MKAAQTVDDEVQQLTAQLQRLMQMPVTHPVQTSSPPLLASYEYLMQQYEEQHEQNKEQISQLERESQQLKAENMILCSQLSSKQPQQQQPLQQMQSNHQFMLEKYEQYRQRNMWLEEHHLKAQKGSVESEKQLELVQAELHSVKMELQQANADLVLCREQKQKLERVLQQSQEGFLREQGSVKDKQIDSLNELLAKATQQMQDMQHKHMEEVKMLTGQEYQKQLLEVSGKYTRLLVDYEWVKGQLTQCQRDLDQRNKEYDIMVQCLEDAEQQPKTVVVRGAQELISELQTERGILVQKEQGYLDRISRLQAELDSDQKDRQHRHNIQLDALRAQQAQIIEQKESIITKLQADQTNTQIKLELTTNQLLSTNKELDKLKSQLLAFKDSTSQRYDHFNKECLEQHQQADQEIQTLKSEKGDLSEQVDKLRGVVKEQERQLEQQRCLLDEQSSQAKWTSDELKRSREKLGQVKEQYDTVLKEQSMDKLKWHNQLCSVTQEANQKVCELQAQVLRLKQEHRDFEQRAETVINTQESIVEKWKQEHRKAVLYYESRLQSK